MQPDLKDILAEIQVTQDSLASVLGVSKQAISDIKAGRSNLTVKHLKSIAETYSLSPTWLLTGEGEKFKSNQSNPPYAITGIEGKIIPVSLVHKEGFVLPMKAVAGLGTVDFTDDISQRLDAIILPNYSFRVQFVISVEGDSMSPTIQEGEMLLANPAMIDEVQENKIYIIHTMSGETLLKRISIDRELRLYMLRSDNVRYGSRIIQEGEIRSIYRVIAKITIPSDF